MNELGSRTTLVGAATGTPDGGVAIVRLSGPRAFLIAEGLCGRVGPQRRLVRAPIQVGAGPDEVEDGLVVFMPEPRSFTGEDVVELHIHAGERNVRAVLEACARGGAVPAGAGDFSRRAFELGAMTLDQAEGVAAVIGAQTDEALAQARRLAGGELGREVEVQRAAVVDLLAEIEANLDFPEDVADTDVVRWGKECRVLAGHLELWLAGFEAGRRARERARVVFAGPPNAGKSSLFNALLGRARALVADEPGTTRDYVEADLDIGRHGVTLVDTAGWRDGLSAVETAGIALSRDQVEAADVVVWVEAADQEPSAEVPSAARVVKVESKRDRGVSRPQWLGLTVGTEVHGLAQLRSALLVFFDGESGAAWIGLARHRACAQEGLVALEQAGLLLAQDGALEAVAFELAVVQRRLGEVTGRGALGPVSGELLERIFSKFCIGK